MQFLTISRRRVDRFSDAEFAPHIPAERERVRELYRDGILRSIWTRTDVPGAVMLLEAADESQARAAVDSLPLAQRDMLDVTFVPLSPYPAFFPIT
ncbi:MAG TPA: muconolactone Delta-isomerase family protein [Candidatus Baltobacteraceae bacterium]